MQSIARSAGITINGRDAHDIRVHDDRFYTRVVAQGSLGLGESYMAGWWDCDQLDELFCRLLGLDETVQRNMGARELLRIATAHLMNRQSLRRARDVTRAHYDLGNHFF